MTYEIYRYIFLGGAILAGIMLVVSVLVFFLLKIPNVIGDLTGANARKAIENIRNQNENTGNKTYRTSQVNRERGKITDKISQSGKLIKSPTHSLHGAMNTEKIGTQKLQNDVGANETIVLDNGVGASETTVLGAPMAGGNETTVLSAPMAGGNETTVLSAPMAGGNETTVLSAPMAGGNETTVLSAPIAGGNETTVLSYEPCGNETTVQSAPSFDPAFVVEYELTYIHTNEVIA